MDIEDIKKIYTGYMLQGMISLSMLAQFILFFWIFFCKEKPIGSIRRNLGLFVHLVADSIAAVSLSNIFQTSMTPACPQPGDQNHQINLLALWATFTLLHLGGHSIFTAFTLNDSKCWEIHLLKFLVYMGTTIIIFLLSVEEGRISYCILLLLFAGILKSCERVLAINRGSMSRLRRSAQKASHASPCCLYVTNEELTTDENIRTLCEAYRCFASHKYIYINHANVNNRFRICVENISIKLLEMELGFAYNMFYSKSVALDEFWGWVSWLLRITSFVLIIAAGILFVCVEGHKLLKNDKAITIILLVKAVALECISFFVSLLSNDTLVKVAHRRHWIWTKLVSMIMACHNSLGPCTEVGQFNLLSYSSTDRKSSSFIRSFLEKFEIKEFIDNYRYSKHVRLNDNQRTLILEEVRTVSDNTKQRPDGIRILEDVKATPIGSNIIEELKGGSQTDKLNVLMKSKGRSFEERLLIYHVATELYHENSNPENGNGTSPEHGNVSSENMKYLEAAKFLSDYMMYLLVVNPSLLLPVLTAERWTYRDTRAETLKFFKDYCSQTMTDMKDTYESLRANYDKMSNRRQTESYKNSVLRDGISVAEYLISKRDDHIGKSLCQLWFEMLCFAASQCEGQNHAKQLGNGRELFTIIWLYMVHLGMSYEYVVQKTNKVFFVPDKNNNEHSTAIAPQGGQNNDEHLIDIPPQGGQSNNENSTAMAPQGGQNNDEHLIDIPPQGGQSNNENSTAMAPQGGQNNNGHSTTVAPTLTQNNNENSTARLQNESRTIEHSNQEE